MTIPIILDTDIGTDIDDTWALAFLLKSPELQLKLVSTTSKNTIERAKIAAKMLEIAGASNVPIAIGEPADADPLPQSPWVKDYSLSDYDGLITHNVPDEIERIVTSSPQPVTIIAIGPLTNIAETLARHPNIVSNARLVGMQGAIHAGYNGSSKADIEYNIAMDIDSAQQVFSSPLDITITPLDTCGLVYLEGPEYEKIKYACNPVSRAVIDNYSIWLGTRPDECRSSILFDTVAVYLAFDEEFVEIKEIKIKVTDEGYTVPDPEGNKIRCAIRWRDIKSFKNLLVERLVG